MTPQAARMDLAASHLQRGEQAGGAVTRIVVSHARASPGDIGMFLIQTCVTFDSRKRLVKGSRFEITSTHHEAGRTFRHIRTRACVSCELRRGTTIRSLA